MSQFDVPTWHETPEGDILPPIIEPEIPRRQPSINRAALFNDHNDIASRPVSNVVDIATVPTNQPDEANEAAIESAVRRHPASRGTSQSDSATIQAEPVTSIQPAGRETYKPLSARNKTAGKAGLVAARQTLHLAVSNTKH